MGHNRKALHSARTREQTDWTRRNRLRYRRRWEHSNFRIGNCVRPLFRGGKGTVALKIQMEIGRGGKTCERGKRTFTACSNWGEICYILNDKGRQPKRQRYLWNPMENPPKPRKMGRLTRLLKKEGAKPGGRFLEKIINYLKKRAKGII